MRDGDPEFAKRVASNGVEIRMQRVRRHPSTKASHASIIGRRRTRSSAAHQFETRKFLHALARSLAFAAIDVAMRNGQKILSLAPNWSFSTIKIVSNDTLRFDIIGHVLLIVHADMPPDAADWARMTMVRNGNLDKLRGVLVIAPPRASINASQRADVAQSMKVTNAATAVVTDSALIRGVARAVGFLGVPVRAFSPAEMGSALNYLVVPQSRHAEVIQRVESLRNQLALRHRETEVHKGP